MRVECRARGAPLDAAQLRSAFDALAPDGSLRSRTAMGLAAVRRFAESAGGSAEAASGPEGTVFAFTLPAVRESPAPQRPPVVLAENHPLLRPMLVEALQATGLRVLVAESEREIAPLLRTPGAILVLNDALATASLADAIRGAAGGRRPPVILLAGAATADVDLGVPVRRLEKPFMFDALLAEIERAAASAGQ